MVRREGLEGVAGERHADTASSWDMLIEQASLRFDSPAAWVRGVMRTESGGGTTRDGRPITFQSGAMALMQVMPLRARTADIGTPVRPVVLERAANDESPRRCRVGGFGILVAGAGFEPAAFRL
jgi:hypothetical protein